MMLAEHIRLRFREIFHTEPNIFRAPGRINLIGEHTDYNEGFVLPAAIDKSAFLAIAPSGGKTGKWISHDFNEQVEISFDEIGPVSAHWANYLLGVVREFTDRNFSIPPFDCILAADVPIGAGLSSSAAVETAVAVALNELFSCSIPSFELAQMIQHAENSFIGLQCGIMDMFTSLHARNQHVMRLDCRTLEYEYFHLSLEGYKMVLLDSGVKHSLASSEYNVRRSQCEEGVALLSRVKPNLKSLRDVDWNLLETNQKILPPIIYNRCRFVLEENDRVFTTCKALQEGDLKKVGKLLYESHEGLSNVYEVSCDELDLLVNLVKDEPGVLGARMMGGGFGGCTLNLVETNEIPSLLLKITSRYKMETGIDLKHYEVVTAEGAGALIMATT